MQHQSINATKQGILSVYRQLLRECAKLPTIAQRTFIKSKARREFRDKNIKTEQDILLHVRLAHTHVENIRAHANHMNKIIYDDRSMEKQKQDEEAQRKQHYEKRAWQSWNDEKH